MFLIYIISLYLILGAGVYSYSVIMNYMFLGFWSFNITDRFIGICEYPKWLLSWVYLILRKVGNKRDGK